MIDIYWIFQVIYKIYKKMLKRDKCVVAVF